MDQINAFVKTHREETLQLLRNLAVIPAPFGKEFQRAAFIRNWLKQNGEINTFTDEVGNVIIPYPRTASPDEKITIVMAHMDIVCPDEHALEILQEGNLLIGPGVRDDTANLVNMLMTIRCFREYQTEVKHPIYFVADVGEEGLGNLKGSRQIWDTYGRQIAEWISFDLNFDVLYHRAVGSHRYRITIRTEGGHSYKDFGKENAIAQLAELITALYQFSVPTSPKVTYNVGVITGGTSVNTIAQEASILYEFRSESQEELQKMEYRLADLLQIHRARGRQISCATVGIRPGNGIRDSIRQTHLENLALQIVQKHAGILPRLEAGSTDCNIPLSQGIPALCIGTALGKGTHTRQETVEIDSLDIGQKIAIDFLLQVSRPED